MDIVYAAYTESVTLMLDENGICRWAVAALGCASGRAGEHLVGSQFVASLDAASTKGLASLPTLGLPMLFAAADETGRILLVRTSRLLRFEDKRAASPMAVDELALTPVLGMPAARRRQRLPVSVCEYSSNDPSAAAPPVRMTPARPTLLLAVSKPPPLPLGPGPKSAPLPRALPPLPAHSRRSRAAAAVRGA